MSGCRCDRLGRVGVNPRRARGHGRVQTFAMQPCELTAVALTATPGDRADVVDQVVPPQRLRAVSAVGESFPLYCCANGKALLAALPP